MCCAVLCCVHCLSGVLAVSSRWTSTLTELTPQIDNDTFSVYSARLNPIQTAVQS